MHYDESEWEREREASTTKKKIYKFFIKHKSERNIFKVQKSDTHKERAVSERGNNRACIEW